MKLKRIDNQKAVISKGIEKATMGLVFALGMQTMIVELTLPRLLAPAFGNTLFCWTAAISEVLAALAIGYHLGGILSSRIASHYQLMWWLGAASSGWVILMAITGDTVVGALSGFGMISGPLVGTLIVAVPPAGVGAAVLPICVAKASLSRDSGRSAGQLYAFSTVGSVIGVLITGYLLLPALGVAGALFTSTVCVFVVCLIAKQFIFGMVGIGIVILSAAFFIHPHTDNILLDKSNGYHRIRVISSDIDPGVRLLYLDNSLEGAVKLGNDNPGIAYQREGVRLALQMQNLKRCFFLGGGAFSMPRLLKSKIPGLAIDVAEIDGDVVNAAKEYLELPPDLNIFIGDARTVLADRPEKYDLIMNDAFHGLRKIPFHLVTREFNLMLAHKLSATGIYAVNVMGHPHNSRLVNSMIRTLQQEFKWVNQVGTKNIGIQNSWILASNHPIPIGQRASAKSELGEILTDNHAPIEFLVVEDLSQEKKR